MAYRPEADAGPIVQAREGRWSSAYGNHMSHMFSFLISGQ